MNSMKGKSPGILLTCGILSSALYFAADVYMSATYEGYSYLHQTVSELNAIGAPTRGLSVVLGIAGYMLLVFFGVGVWLSAAGSRALRVVAGALVALGSFGIWGVAFASMQMRGTQQEGPHLISGAVGALLVVIAIGFAAPAFGRPFWRYSVATIVVMLVFGGWAAMDAGRIEAGLATPWVGVIERISFYSWHLWFILLAHRLALRGSRARNMTAA